MSPQYLVETASNLDFLAQVEDGSVQLFVTSPPYNLGKEYEIKQSLDKYLDNQRQVIEKCIQKLKDCGSICWQVGNYVDCGKIVPLDILLYPIFAECGLTLRNRIIWTFNHGLHCSKRFSGRHETILWFTKSNNYTFNLDPVRVPQKYPNKKYFKGPKKGQLSCNPLGGNPGDVWAFSNVKHNHPEKTIHPCQFPLALAERLVLALSSPGDAVCDPFMGAGTTVVAAVKYGRLGMGCDIVDKYVEITRERIRSLELDDN